MNSLLARRCSLVALLGISFSSVGCFYNFDPASYFGYNRQPMYPGPQGQTYTNQPPMQQPQRGGFFNRWNTDYTPRYGYNGQVQPNYPGGMNESNRGPGPYPYGPQHQPSPAQSKPKTKPKGESAANLHKKETKPSTPSTAKSETKAKSTAAEVPYGTPAIGKKGYVYSPHAPDKGMVDVTDIPAGTKVECPYTGKHFRVP